MALSAGRRRSRNPAAIDAVHQPGERKAARSVRGAPRSAEVCLRCSHIGSLEEPPWLPDPHRKDLLRVVRGWSVLRTAALSSLWQGETSEERRLFLTLLESLEDIKQSVNFPIK